MKSQLSRRFAYKYKIVIPLILLAALCTSAGVYLMNRAADKEIALTITNQGPAELSALTILYGEQEISLGELPAGKTQSKVVPREDLKQISVRAKSPNGDQLLFKFPAEKLKVLKLIIQDGKILKADTELRNQ
jgi:hypothetical protein